MDANKSTIERVKEHLIKKGINPSYQRLKILEYLESTKSHPTVEMIYRELLKEIPTLSKTTIYNTLNLFQKKGLVYGITIEENEVRYDADTNPHIHFKCKKCGIVYDLPMKQPFSSRQIDSKHSIEEVQIYCKGICENCISSS